MPPRSTSFPLLSLLFVILIVTALWWLSPRRDALVVYCAHDAEFSEPILKEFERRSGIPVLIQFDTEATKSLGLIQRIKAEKQNPQCDVFWNNETLGTMDLADEGFLFPYRSPTAERIPEKYKDPAGRWSGFAARLRVVIYNKDLIFSDQVPDTESKLLKLVEQAPKEFAIAKPIFGTTLTHYSALWKAWGGEKLQSWHRRSLAAGIQEVAGNAKSKDLAASGNCRAGFTDTDDFFVAQDAGHPVGMVPVRLTDGTTICIPNTAGIISGSRKIEAARKLIDFLLSEEVELRLAESTARQIPLGTVDSPRLPEQVKDLMDDAAAGLDLRTLSQARNDCLEWLRKEYLQ